MVPAAILDASAPVEVLYRRHDFVAKLVCDIYCVVGCDQQSTVVEGHYTLEDANTLNGIWVFRFVVRPKMNDLTLPFTLVVQVNILVRVGIDSDIRYINRLCVFDLEGLLGCIHCQPDDLHAIHVFLAELF